MRNREGFTLIELIIVVMVLGILLTIAFCSLEEGKEIDKVCLLNNSETIERGINNCRRVLGYKECRDLVITEHNCYLPEESEF